MRRAVLTRRFLIGTAGIAALPAPGRAQDAPLPPVVIGVLTDRTGIGAAVSGPPLVQAVRMAAQDAGALPDGRPISIVTASYRLKPDEALAIAESWFDQGVSVIVDVPGSAAAVAVQALARSRGRTTLVTGSVNPALTGQACSPFGSSWGIDSVSMTTALAGALARSGTKTWFLVAPDTVLGQAVQSDAVRSIASVGGQVAGQSRHPAGSTDFASIVTRTKDSGARAVGLCDVAGDLAGQLGQFRAGGLFDDGRTVVAFLPAIADIHTAGAAAAHGLILASPFYWSQNDQARSLPTGSSPPPDKCPMRRTPPPMSPCAIICAPWPRSAAWMPALSTRKCAARRFISSAVPLCCVWTDVWRSTCRYCA